ncbi:MAG: hypothetical protein J6S67_15505 [Methanobrevibacter sp.]|nr:hypothetical protein [Methanobrevibacter sp.]
MKRYRKYVQFNDLVFYSYITNSDDVKVDFDIVKKSYTFKNGDYAPLKNRTPRIQSTTVGITMEFNFKQIACDLRSFYRRFIVEQLSKAGKLWSVQGDDLLWAYAVPESYSEPTRNLYKNTLEVDVQFYLPEGVWHKADKQKTFVIDFDICEFLRCLDYQKLNPCCDCASCIDTHDCCCCDELTKEDALCDRVLDVYDNNCVPNVMIKYDCLAAERIFTGISNEYLGQRICRDPLEDEIISGQVYVEGDIPTQNYKIILNGPGENVRITINGNTNILSGEYEGPIIIDSSGNIIDGCDEKINIDRYVIPDGNTFGFTFYPGWNSVIIEPNECCTMQCAYFQIDNLTV